MAFKKQRQAKLQARYRPLSFGEKFVPQLSISGVWLEDVGFNIYDTVTITIQKEKLIIELQKPV